MISSAIGGGTGQALFISQSGLSDATLRLANSAHNIANSNTDQFIPDHVNSVAHKGGGVSTVVQPGQAPQFSPSVDPATVTFTSQTDLVTEMTNVILAKNAFGANAALLGTQSDVMKTTIEAVG
ncbi:MAG: hypothetical protein KTR14_06480 [Vampirovibrio sp.]|nr:hypothetical protein [Vampirovibrio sp.]